MNFKIRNSEFKQLVKQILTAKSSQVHIGYGIDQFLDYNASKKNVIYFAWDHWGHPFEIEPSTINVREKVIEKAQKSPDQNFWIFHSWLNFESYLGTDLPPNLKTVKFIDEIWTWGDGSLYSTVQPQTEKNFNSNKHWISLGGNRRPVRYIVAMYLLGTNATDTGSLNLDPTLVLEHESWDSYLSYWNYNQRPEIFSIQHEFDILQKGFDKIKQGIGYETKSYRDVKTDAPTSYKFFHKNFDQGVRYRYQDSFVEIVNETMFMEPVGIVTEKFLNNVYGFNLPIILNVPNTVEHLRNQGFDLFDDVIDHSYDTVQEPLPRLVQAINKNMKLLTDEKLAKTAWRHCKHRMQKNIQVAQQEEAKVDSRVRSLLFDLNRELLLHE
jgi:hypothetical protein